MAAKRVKNPVPRELRRKSIEWATGEEFAHADHAKYGRVVAACWFCQHEPAEHLDHDFLNPGCPDCAADAKRTNPGIPKVSSWS